MHNWEASPDICKQDKIPTLPVTLGGIWSQKAFQYENGQTAVYFYKAIPFQGLEGWKQGSSETAELNHSMGRKKDLLEIKLPRLTLGGQRDSTWQKSECLWDDGQQCWGDFELIQTTPDRGCSDNHRLNVLAKAGDFEGGLREVPSKQTLAYRLLFTW